MKFDVQDGMKVLVVGYVSVYEASGSYQIRLSIWNQMASGHYIKLEQLKEKLSQEGLFTHRKSLYQDFQNALGSLQVLLGR